MTANRDLDDLFRIEAARLQRFLRQFGSSVSIEDVSQESFARLCAMDVDTIDSPRAYLFRTARNLALNALRRERGAPVGGVADPERLGVGAEDPSPEDKLLSRETAALLKDALAQLPAHKCEALLLFRLEGWSHREIGRHLGVSHRTVERYIADALAHCHGALARHLSEHPGKAQK